MRQPVLCLHLKLALSLSLSLSLSLFRVKVKKIWDRLIVGKASSPVRYHKVGYPSPDPTAACMQHVTYLQLTRLDEEQSLLAEQSEEEEERAGEGEGEGEGSQGGRDREGGTKENSDEELINL